MATEFTPEVVAREAAAEAELLAMSNWGRWGSDDELGALNLVDLAAIRRGMAAVRVGQTLSISQRIEPTAPRGESRPPNQLFMAIDGGDFAAGARPYGSIEGGVSNRGAAPFAVGDEAIFITTHNGSTHVDALSHYWINGEMYNGFSGDHVSSSGAKKLGIEKMGGMVTRGILLDIAKLRGVVAMEAMDYITEDDVLAATKAAGVEVEPGDAIIFHTGWHTVYQQNPAKWRSTAPGLGSSAALYLAKKEISLVGVDNMAIHGSAKKYPAAGEGRLNRPSADLHVSYLRNLGIYLLEMLDLDELAALGTTEFLLCVAPLMVTGATGSPVNPLAVI